ncbi:MAG: sulfotransferase [Planctomycetes bacterium]|nr:sulfotransferase [Planctomycetota bacterium]
MSIAPDPIVILGAPRSGTTFLNELVNAHPRVHVTHEMRLFAWAHHCLVTAAADDRLLVTHRDEFLAHARRSFAPLIRGFYAERFPGKDHWGDKNPHYADPANRGCLGTVRALFPGAKFVHIVRDGRDVVASLVRRHHADGRPWADLPTACRVWCEHTAIARGFGRTLDDGAYLELRYEDLVRDESAQARELFAFLGIPSDPAVEAFCLRQRAARTALSTPTRDIAADVLASDFGRVLSAADQARALEALGAGLAAFGYPVDGGAER